MVLREPHQRERLYWLIAANGSRILSAPRSCTWWKPFPRTATGKIRAGSGGDGASQRNGGMKFLIAGAGAIGGYIGARMAQGGECDSCSRAVPHLWAMQKSWDSRP